MSMSMSASRPARTAKFDPAPDMRPAGKTQKNPGDQQSVASCFQTIEVPGTPPKMNKYRDSWKGQPGKRIQHWGTVDDGTQPEGYAYGHKTGMVLDSKNVLNTHQPTRVEEFLTTRKEAIYDSSKMEPLGKRHGKFTIPDDVQGSTFGKPTVGSEQAKVLLFPKDTKCLSGEIEERDPKLKAQYLKSHGTWAPGEQKTRNYQWNLDPTNHRFGHTDKEDYREGVKKAINPAAEHRTGVLPTTVVPKRVDDFRRVKQDELGKPRNLGLGQPDLGSDHKFGMPSMRVEDWGVAECVQGEYSIEEQMPDNDLGRSVTRGCAPEHIVREDGTRIFGVPSIRADIHAPNNKSVADPQNYGDEPTVKELLYPGPFADRGVNETDFEQTMPRGEMEDLMLTCGAIKSAATFDAVWHAASEDYGVDDAMSVDMFRRKMIELSLAGEIPE